VTIEQPAVTVYQHDLGQILHILGVTLTARGQLDEARALLQRARAIFEKLHHASPGDPSFEESLRDAERALAQVERDAQAAQHRPPASVVKTNRTGRPS
jgi:hypothetical protein